MFRLLKNCLGRIVLALLLLVALFVGWKWGGLFFPVLEEWVGLSPAEEGREVVVGPRLADSVLAELQAFGRGEAGSRMAVGGPEVTSLRLVGRELATQTQQADHTGQRSLGLPPAPSPRLDLEVA